MWIEIGSWGTIKKSYAFCCLSCSFRLGGGYIVSPETTPHGMLVTSYECNGRRCAYVCVCVCAAVVWGFRIINLSSLSFFLHYCSPSTFLSSLSLHIIFSKFRFEMLWSAVYCVKWMQFPFCSTVVSPKQFIYWPNFVVITNRKTHLERKCSVQWNFTQNNSLTIVLSEGGGE